MRISLKVTTLTLIAGALAVGGCRKKEEEPPAQYQPGYGQPGYQQPGYQQPGYQQPQPGQPGYQQPPPGQPTAPPPGQPGAPLPGMQQPSTGQASPIDPAAGAVVQPLLNQLAAQSAPPGAKPLGSPLMGNFQTGQTLESQIQLQPGKCYTVVAAGMPPGVTEVNVQFITTVSVPGFAPVLAQDNVSGYQAVLGPNPDCYKWPLPMAVPVKVVLTVAGGSGMAAAQVYEK